MIVNQIPSHQVPHPPYLHQVHLPLTEFAAFFRGQQVEDAPPLDLNKVTILISILLEFTTILCFVKRLYLVFLIF